MSEQELDLEQLLQELDSNNKQAEVVSEPNVKKPELISNQAVVATEPSLPTDSILSAELSKLDELSAELLTNYRADRKELQALVNHYDLDDGELSADTMELLTEMVSTKATMNMQIVKLIEAKAKMFAALKASSGNNVNISIGGDDDLSKILETPLSSEDA